MMLIAGTIPIKELPLTIATVRAEGEFLVINGHHIPTTQGTGAMIGAALATTNYLTLEPAQVLVAGDTGRGKGSRKIYEFLLSFASILCSLPFIIAAVFFFMWIHRVYSNLPALGAGGLICSPAWAVGGFLVPFLNLLHPFQVVREIWKASDPTVETSDGLAWKSAPTSPLIASWWVLWLVLFPMTTFVGYILWVAKLNLRDLGGFTTQGWLLFAWCLLFIVAAMLTKRVVQKIDLRQEEKHMRITAEPIITKSTEQRGTYVGELAVRKGVTETRIEKLLRARWSLAVLMVLATAVVGALVYLAVPKPPIVTFPDANLEAAIREGIRKPEGAIDAADLRHLIWLPVRGRGISDITGLEHYVTEVAIDLADNNISDISPLAGLTRLQILDLGDNNISDISPLAGLTNLGRLNLADNNISDISPLTELTNLWVLNLTDNSISDISPLAGLTNLGSLNLGGNNISDISPLAGLTNLSSLNLQLNNISDISPLAGLTLGSLDLGDNNISDISPLAGLTNLGSLNLGGNNISDVSPLAGLMNRGSLNLADNNISDISPLANLTRLQSLDLANNNISDISPLAGFFFLRTLDLRENSISDISPLIKLISGLSYFDMVDLRGNPLSSTSVNVYIPQLQERGVDVKW